MKSRLLPPPATEGRARHETAPAGSYARRTTDHTTDEVEVQAAPPTTKPAEPALAGSIPLAPRPAPQVSARPRGRPIVAGLLLTCIVSVIYCLWSTFLRDAAYGTVVGQTTRISTAWPGTVTAIYIAPGDAVRQGEVMIVLDDPELQASIDRLSDDLRTAQAELDARVALLAVAARERGNSTEVIRAEYYDLRGELVAEQSRHEEIVSKLTRRQELVDQHAYSSEEIESLRFVAQGLAAKIENLQQAVAALENRLANLPADEHDAAQLLPYLAELENGQAEIRRLRDRQRRGTLCAPINGTVVDVACRVGERATPNVPILEILPSDGVQLVLYVQPSDAAGFQVGQQTKVVVESATEPVACQITRVGQRLETPKSHVLGRYRPEEKLLPVYLAPTSVSPSDTPLRIGSTVRLPATLFGL